MLWQNPTNDASPTSSSPNNLAPITFSLSQPVTMSVTRAARTLSWLSPRDSHVISFPRCGRLCEVSLVGLGKMAAGMLMLAVATAGDLAFSPSKAVHCCSRQLSHYKHCLVSSFKKCNRLWLLSAHRCVYVVLKFVEDQKQRSATL